MTETAVHSLTIQHAPDGEYVFACPACGYLVMVDEQCTLRVIDAGDPLARHTTGKDDG